MKIAPTFAEIAAGLLEVVHHNARLNELSEPLMEGIPVLAPGMRDANAKRLRRTILVVEAQRLVAAMAGWEAAHRS